MVDYAVNQYLADLGLSYENEPTEIDYSTPIPYSSLKALAGVSEHIETVAMHCTPEKFQTLIDQLARSSVLTVVYPMICARILITQGRPELIPEIISIASY